MRISMDRAEALNIKAGDMVTPVPLWNRTERPRRQIESPTEVIDVLRDNHCQTGVMVTVRTKGGDLIALDAAWFGTVQN